MDYKHLIISDADVEVPSDFLANVVQPLSDPKVGLVNCFYRLTNPTTLAMQWAISGGLTDFQRIPSAADLMIADVNLPKGTSIEMPGRKVVVTSLVTVQAFREPSIYEGKTIVQIQAKQQNVLATGTGGGVIINAPSDPNFWNTQLRLLQNPVLARQVVLTLGLQNNPAFLGGQAPAPGYCMSLDEHRRAVLREHIRERLPMAEDGSIRLVARAWAVRGRAS